MLVVTPLSGFILVDKPEGLTSLSVVRRLKRVLRVEHIGHLGTLDPFASGLLPVLVGGAARLADLAHEGLKGYDFSLILGRETDTLDPLGSVVVEAPVPLEVAACIDDIIPRFIGEIRQVPPVYSAIKMNGVALYEHMRSKGGLPCDVESKTRTVLVESLQILEVRQATGVECELDFRLVCGKGTYVRSLARDLALALGSRGFCSRLRRTLVGPWSVADAVPFRAGGDEISFEQASAAIRPAVELVPHLPVLELDSSYRRLFAVGNGCRGTDGLTLLRLGSGSTEGSPSYCLVSCAEIQFLCELRTSGDLARLSVGTEVAGPWELQPRKRIC